MCAKYFRARSYSVVSVVMSVVASIVLVGTWPAAAGAGQAPRAQQSYFEPVDGVVIDAFRPPPNPYAAGNRGLDYLTAPGSSVRAAGDGQVIFAGQVAGSLHVTVRHPDGLRTSYSFLESLGTAVGQSVHRGDPLATASLVTHFGVRTPDGTYLDPADLLNPTGPRVVARLIPGADEGLAALTSAERRSLLDLVLHEGAHIVGRYIDDKVDAALLALHYAIDTSVVATVARFEDAMIEWLVSSANCTASDVDPPTPGSRRIVIEVAGLGSTSENGAIARLDTDALGYDDSDVIRFSYSGGRVSSGDSDSVASELSTIPVTTYTSADTQVDMRESAERLARLVEEVARLAPGVPIDVIAHSQGGVVTRIAVDVLASSGHLPDEVENVITLSSPHQGSNVATAVAATRSGPTGRAVLAGVQAVSGLDLDPYSASISQLSEISDLTREMADVRPPQGVRFTSLAGRGDLTVPAATTRVPGATRAVLPLVGPTAHDTIPGSEATTREVGLALAGLPPTCVSFGSALVDLGVGELVTGAEDLVGVASLTVNAVGPQFG